MGGSKGMVKCRGLNARKGQVRGIVFASGEERICKWAETRVVWVVVVGVLAKSQLGREVLGLFGPWHLGLGLAFDH